VSLAVSKAGAVSRQIPLYQHYADIAGNKVATSTMPIPCFNVINGGEHAGNALPFQEFFVIPTGAESFSEAMEIGCNVFHVRLSSVTCCVEFFATAHVLCCCLSLYLKNLKKVIKSKFGGDATLIGDEGGFAPPCDVESGLQMIMEATEKSGYLDKVSVGLDVASSEFKSRVKTSMIWTSKPAAHKRIRMLS
jgi:enolase